MSKVNLAPIHSQQTELGFVSILANQVLLEQWNLCIVMDVSSTASNGRYTYASIDYRIRFLVPPSTCSQIQRKLVLLRGVIQHVHQTMFVSLGTSHKMLSYMTSSQCS